MEADSRSEGDAKWRILRKKGVRENALSALRTGQNTRLLFLFEEREKVLPVEMLIILAGGFQIMSPS
jgi:hypothetical protein